MHRLQAECDAGAFGGLQHRLKLSEISKSQFVRPKSQELQGNFPESRVAFIFSFVSPVRKSQTKKHTGLMQNSMLELLVAFNTGSSCQKFQKANLFGQNLRR
jgi:hypothetical protein